MSKGESPLAPWVTGSSHARRTVQQYAPHQKFTTFTRKAACISPQDTKQTSPLCLCYVPSTPLYGPHPNINRHTDTNTTYRFHDWSAYSSSGNITGLLYYLNHGTLQDFQFAISSSPNISLNNSIGLFRSGGISNPSKIVNAHKYGLKGVLIFDDIYPNQSEVYPNGPYLPKSGYMLGFVKNVPCIGNPSPERLDIQCGLNASQAEDVFPSLEVELYAPRTLIGQQKKCGCLPLTRR